MTSQSNCSVRMALRSLFPIEPYTLEEGEAKFSEVIEWLKDEPSLFKEDPDN